MSVPLRYDLAKSEPEQPLSAITIVPSATNPGGTNTLWIKSSDGHLQKGSTDLQAGGLRVAEIFWNTAGSGPFLVVDPSSTITTIDPPLGDSIFTTNSDFTRVGGAIQWNGTSSIMAKISFSAAAKSTPSPTGNHFYLLVRRGGNVSYISKDTDVSGLQTFVVVMNRVLELDPGDSVYAAFYVDSGDCEFSNISLSILC